MKNLMLLIGLIGSATTAFGQSTNKTSQIVQKGNKNVINMEVKGNGSDTLAAPTRIITQHGNNQIHIESTTSPDSLNQVLENVAIEQQGKSNAVSIQSKGGKGNSVQITQSGSGNSISIKQN